MGRYFNNFKGMVRLTINSPVVGAATAAAAEAAEAVADEAVAADACCSGCFV